MTRSCKDLLNTFKLYKIKKEALIGKHAPNMFEIEQQNNAETNGYHLT